MIVVLEESLGLAVPSLGFLGLNYEIEPNLFAMLLYKLIFSMQLYFDQLEDGVSPYNP